MIKFRIFRKYPNLICGLSQKKDGPMKFRSENRNKLKFLRKYKICPNQIVSAGIVHGIKITEVNKLNRSKIIRGSDGLLTKEKNLYLTITVADCFPVYLFDPKTKSVGLIHVGWKNIVKNIIKMAIFKMSEDLKSKPKDIRVCIGPGIQKCHFEIKEDVLKKFSVYRNFVKRQGSRYFIDLKAILKKQLRNAGTGLKNLEASEICAFCNKNYYSYRRDKTKKLRAQLAFIGLKSNI